MSIYAANNILRGTANYDPDRIGGLIFNSRGDPAEDGRVKAFSEAVGVPVIAVFGRSPIFMEAEKQGKTVVEMRPDSPEASSFRGLAKRCWKEGDIVRDSFPKTNWKGRYSEGPPSRKRPHRPPSNRVP